VTWTYINRLRTESDTSSHHGIDTRNHTCTRLLLIVAPAIENFARACKRSSFLGRLVYVLGFRLQTQLFLGPPGERMTFRRGIEGGSGERSGGMDIHRERELGGGRGKRDRVRSLTQMCSKITHMRR
jgi:hypothetical protein